MKLFAAILLGTLLVTAAAAGQGPKWSDCIGVNKEEDGSIVFPSPMSANAECYSDMWVNDSRLASLLAFNALVREFGLDVTMTAMPISWQVEESGPMHPAWEVYIYSAETSKVLMLFLVKAETGLVKKVCDNRFEDQHCRKIGEG